VLSFDWSIITSNLDIIILNVILFFLFALIGSLGFRKKENRRSAGAATAATTLIVAESFGFSQRLASVVSFIVAFYIQMHGLAVSAYAFLWLFGQNPVGYTSYAYLLTIPGIALFAIGVALVFFGWDKIFKAKDRYLVTDGLYKYMRHPQYTGILLVTFGMIVYQFSPISLLLWPFLLVIYYRLARKEEKIMQEKWGEKYSEYKSRVHMFLPLGFMHKHK
jgi:protein-S-isoprenylcysteine O-methyltransferase Ste14